jgi:hypothetical protein
MVSFEDISNMPLAKLPDLDDNEVGINTDIDRGKAHSDKVFWGLGRCRKILAIRTET